MLFWTLSRSTRAANVSTFYTSTKSWRCYIFTAVCLCVCVRLFSCEQNFSRTDALIWTRFSLNGCLMHWLRPYWNWWLWVKGQGHSNLKHVSIYEQNTDQTGQPSLKQSSLSGCFLHWFKPYNPIEIYDFRSKVKVTVTRKKNSQNFIYAYLWI